MCFSKGEQGVRSFGGYGGAPRALPCHDEPQHRAILQHAGERRFQYRLLYVSQFNFDQVGGTRSLARQMLHQVLPVRLILPRILRVLLRVFCTANTENTAVLTIRKIVSTVRNDSVSTTDGRNTARSGSICPTANKCCEVPAVPAALKTPGIHEFEVRYVLMLEDVCCCYCCGSRRKHEGMGAVGKAAPHRSFPGESRP